MLLKQLFRYGIRGSTHWMRDYSKDRQQYLFFNGRCSSNVTVPCGVPQGSILVPLVFLIYVNDMSNVSQLLCTLSFGDDTNVFTIGKEGRQLIVIKINYIILAYLVIVLLTIQILGLMDT